MLAKRVSTTVLIAAISMACTSVAAADSAALKPKWKTGHTTYVEWQFEGKFVYASAAGEETRGATMRETVGVLCKVVERLPEGGARLVVTFDRLAISDDVPDGRMTCDSDTEDLSASDYPFCSVMHSVLGKSYTVELDGEGNVTRVQGLTDILEAVRRKSNDKHALQYATAELDGQTHETLWNTFHALYAFRNVEVGDTWTRTIRTYRGSDQYRYNVKYIGERDERPTITVGYTISALPSTETQPAEFLEGIRFENRRTRGEGTAVFDIERGQFVEVQETGEERAHLKKKVDAAGETKTLDRQVTWRRSIIVLREAERRQQKADRRKAGDG